jgi:hypothetical protein
MSPDSVVMHICRVQEAGVGREGCAMNTGIVGVVVVLDALVKSPSLVDGDDGSTARCTPEVGSVDVVRWVHVCDHVNGSSNTALGAGDGAVPGNTAAVVDRVANVDRWFRPVCFAWGVYDVGSIEVCLVMLHSCQQC